MITNSKCPWPWRNHGVIALARVAATVELPCRSPNALTILPSHADRRTMASQKVDNATETTVTTTPDNKNDREHPVVIASSDSLPNIVQSSSPSDNDNGDIASRKYTRCVQPGAYMFAISDSAGDGLGNDGESGYYVEANGVTLGVRSFFYNEERMSFSLPFDAEEDRHHHGDSDDDDSVCTDDFVLAIRTDGNPGETTWDVVDDRTGRRVLQGGPYARPDAVYTRRACLPDSEYTFNMLDEGGDGLCSDGQFGREGSTAFTLGEALVRCRNVR